MRPLCCSNNRKPAACRNRHFRAPGNLSPTYLFFFFFSFKSLCLCVYLSLLGFPGSSDCRESACSAGDLGSIPGLGRSPGERNSKPCQYSCLGNPMDRGAWQATVHGVEKSQTQLNTAQPSSKSEVCMCSHQSRQSTSPDRPQFPQPLEMWLLLPELPFLCLCLSGSYASFKTQLKHYFLS